ncbi:Uma2 family endonuclease [Altericista sp. CCNU0014]|uniref:Uma2 family endonuclease n=1 Tax=Altericista sp. CCNU0014 TaxID=3082949 RepID=UPI00384EC321
MILRDIICSSRHCYLLSPPALLRQRTSTHASLIPSLAWIQVERGASRLQAKYCKFTYPDMMVIQGQPVSYENRTDTLINPRLIFEVLFKSTEEYDQGDKFNTKSTCCGYTSRSP